MTTKENGNPKKQKKLFFIAITVFAILITISIIVIILQQKDEYKYCKIFQTEKEAELCRKLIDTEGRPPYIDCMPCGYFTLEEEEYCQKQGELCEKARKTGYPYITY